MAQIAADRIAVSTWSLHRLLGMTYPEGANPNDPDAITRYLVVDGSYVRREGTVVLDSLSKVYMTATKTGAGLDVLLQGQPVINAWLRAAQKPSAINLNGRAVAPAYDPAARNLCLRLGAEK